jgi:transposase
MSNDYVAGEKRNQTILFPDTLDEYVTEENPVRFIDAFVGSLDLEQLGFKHSKLDGGAGRPPYDPSDLLKLYIYGYLNQVRSSRRLEKACLSNVEVMWLMKKLAPDFKTISDFRKDNIECIKPVFKEFVFLCRSLDLFGAELVAIDGSKFKAVNSTKRNLNEKTLAERLKRVEERIAEYLKEMEENDKVDEEEEHNDNAAKVEKLKEKLSKLEEKRQEYVRTQNEMRETGQKEVSLTDPDSRLMRVDSQKLDVCYNVESAVDSKNHLVVDYDVISISDDHNELARMAEAAKETLEVEKLDVTADKGFYKGDELKECEENGITTYVSIPEEFMPNKKLGVPEPEFYSSKFSYDPLRDVYTCPANQVMTFWKGRWKNRGRLYRTEACATCPLRSRCTRNKLGRIIYRSEYQDIIDRLRARLKSDEGIEKLNMRKEIAEHPFGTMKRAFNQGYLLLKGLRKVNGEVGFTMLAYNMRRAINILGTKRLTGSIGVMM